MDSLSISTLSCFHNSALRTQLAKISRRAGLRLVGMAHHALKVTREAQLKIRAAGVLEEQSLRRITYDPNMPAEVTVELTFGLGTVWTLEAHLEIAAKISSLSTLGWNIKAVDRQLQWTRLATLAENFTVIRSIQRIPLITEIFDGIASGFKTLRDVVESFTIGSCRFLIVLNETDYRRPIFVLWGSLNFDYGRFRGRLAGVGL